MELLRIHTANELVRVSADEILYVLADGNYSDMIMVSGAKHTFTFQIHYFEELFNKLEDNPFLRVTRSLIVNVRHVYLININDRIIKFGGKNVDANVPILRLGRDSLKKFKEFMADYDERSKHN